MLCSYAAAYLLQMIPWNRKHPELILHEQYKVAGWHMLKKYHKGDSNNLFTMFGLKGWKTITNKQCHHQC